MWATIYDHQFTVASCAIYIGMYDEWLKGSREPATNTRAQSQIHTQARAHKKEAEG